MFLNGLGVRAAEPQPRILNGVVCLVAGAQHPQRHRPQMVAVGLKALGEQVGVAHGHILSVAVVIPLTNHTGAT